MLSADSTMATSGTSRRRGRTIGAVLICAVLMVSGCALVPPSVKVATGQAKEYTAYFDNVAGLYEGNDVAVLGMPVGRITGVEPQGTRVKVEFTVDSDIDVPKDVTAAIVNTSIVTTRHVELTPAYTDGPKLDDGGVVEHTKAPVEIGTLFDSLDKMIAALTETKDGQKPVSDLIDITSKIADGNGTALRDALDSLSKAGKVGSDNADAIGTILGSISELTKALTDNYPKMLSFSNSITKVSDLLGDQSAGLVATLNDLNQALANTSQFLASNSGVVGGSMKQLAGLAANLSDYSRQVVETIDLGPLLFQNLSNSISAEQGAWRAQVLLDKSLLDNELLSKFCEAINLQRNGCRTGQLKDFGPDLGVFSGLLELSKK